MATAAENMAGQERVIWSESFWRGWGAKLTGIKDILDTARENLKELPATLRSIGTVLADTPTRRALTEIAVGIVRSGAKRILAPEVERIPTRDDQIEAMKGEKLMVWLVHPTNYDEEGRPRKWIKQILPSNAIGQLHALMPREIRGEDGQEIPVGVQFIEDTAQDFDLERIMRSIESEGAKGVVMLVGIQTSQLPRAFDLAQLCREKGIPVIAGGYHVRADLPLTQKQAKERGISLAIGEAESDLNGKPFLQAILNDVWAEELKPEYRQEGNPKIENERLPDIIASYQDLMINRTMITLETSRGCPYLCSFCAIKNIGGSEVRSRQPEHTRAWLVEAYQMGIRSIFITDDNFAKSDQRLEILRIFKELGVQGMPFKLMIQVDTTATKGEKGKEFIEACKEAGVQAVFLGIESVDPDVIKKMGKGQNKPEKYDQIIKDWHDANIMTQCGFIIGNPGETVGVGRRSARALIEMGMDVAAAYIRVPLPGTEDYYRFFEEGWINNLDFNAYDCHSASCISFPDGLSPEQVMQEYEEFYKEFFQLKNLVPMAKRLRGEALKAAMRQFFWYIIARIQGNHPMYSGLFRRKPDYKRQQFPDRIPSLDEIGPRPGAPGDPNAKTKHSSGKLVNIQRRPSTIEGN